MADYKKRIHSTQQNSAVSAGYKVDPIPIPNNVTNFKFAAAGSVVTGISVNIAPGSGSVIVTMSGQTILQAVTARDYRIPFFASSDVYISLPDSTANVTCYVAPGYAKGAIY